MMTTLFYFVALVFIISACAAGLTSYQTAISNIQNRYSQKCMKCPEIIVSKQYDVLNASNTDTCGNTRINYYTYWNHSTCAKAIVHCSTKISSPHYVVKPLPRAYIYIQESELNPPQCVLEELDKLAIEEFRKQYPPEVVEYIISNNKKNKEDRIKSGNDYHELHHWISKEQDYYTFSILTCNDNRNWQIDTASDSYKVTIRGIQIIHCHGG